MIINIGANFRIHKIGLCLFIVFLIFIYIYAIRGLSNLSSKKNNLNSLSLRSLLADSIYAAEIGGLEIVHVHSQAKVSIELKGKTAEGVDDPVTTADYRSHCVMNNYLSSSYPSVTIISEEQSKECDNLVIKNQKDFTDRLKNIDIETDITINAEDITVWIDPLDATKEFTENLLEYVTTMVCIAVKGIPVIGVIHKPFEPKQTYWAWGYHGLSKNLQTVKRKSNKNMIIVSRSHAGKVHNISRAVLGEDVIIVSAAGAGYKSLEVAVGNVSAYIHMTAIKKWDVCAGAAIINALGGTITSLSGEPMVDFRSTDSLIFNHGLLAAMTDHSWYLNKFYKT
ncbi:hypothetical protein G9C98_001806 [Cotesia typhae]|uniref:inositol-phosphate phosphatase n=1 Tax=Cotesia typhae TaxID=2053667 RepID=A0A8J5VBL7_9HYME|nr:hypothetical protein G9C98_001806 [Cotesia typhae]